FKYMRDGEELLHEPFQRLVADKELVGHPHDGFWMSMDTFKDKQVLDELHSRGHAPWEVWNRPPNVEPFAPRSESVTTNNLGSARALTVRQGLPPDIRA